MNSVFDDDREARHAAVTWSRAWEAVPDVRRAVLVELGEVVLDRQAVCIALASEGASSELVRLRRRALYLETDDVRLLVDPVAPGAFARTPFGERHRSLEPAVDAVSVLDAPLVEALVAASVDPASLTALALTNLRGQWLSPLTGVDRGAGGVVAPLLGPRPIHVGAGLVAYAARGGRDLARSTLPRPETFDATRLVEAAPFEKLGRSILFVTTDVPDPGALAVVFRHRGRTQIFTPSAHLADAHHPYESSRAGLRRAARLHDLDVAPRGDVGDLARAFRVMRFERDLADADPSRPSHRSIVTPLAPADECFAL